MTLWRAKWYFKQDLLIDKRKIGTMSYISCCSSVWLEVQVILMLFVRNRSVLFYSSKNRVDNFLSHISVRCIICVSIITELITFLPSLLSWPSSKDITFKKNKKCKSIYFVDCDTIIKVTIKTVLFILLLCHLLLMNIH